MKIHRFFFDHSEIFAKRISRDHYVEFLDSPKAFNRSDFNFTDDLFFLRDREIINQIKNVLKLRKGEFIILINSDKKEAKSQIVNINDDFVQLRLFGISENENGLVGKVVLYCSILKKDNFEWVVQKATEVGVSEIVPTIFQRTIKMDLNFTRINKIIKEACEQSERGELTKLSEIKDFKEILKNKEIQSDLNIICDRSGIKLNDFLNKFKGLDKTINIFIGPEGGLSSDEIFFAQKNGFEVVNLGNLMMRGETAAIIASFVFVNLL